MNAWEAAGTPEAAHVYLSALMEALVQAGVHHLVFCPGSRSTPVLLTAHRTPNLRLWQHVDERSAGFFALGMARALGEPVAVLVTSGTAAANLHPAVAEARYGRVPLVLLTADRPRELREVGAPQTIDQVGLFGPHAKASLELPLPEGSPRMVRHAQATGARAAALAREAPAGPVHLNLPLREPLIPRPPAAGPGEEGLASRNAPAATLGGIRVEAGRRSLEPEAIASLAEELLAVRRGLVVVGPQDDPSLAGPVARLAQRLGWPLLADPLSQLRQGPAGGGQEAAPRITTYDAFLRVPGAFERLAPGGVLRLGAAPVSKVLGQFLEHHAGVPQWVVDEAPAWRDPAQTATRMVWAEPRRLAEQLTAALSAGEGAADPARALDPLGVPERPWTGASDRAETPWLEMWRRLEEASAGALAEAVHAPEPGELFEGRVFAELASLLPEGSLLFAGNSMPVRDLDAFHRGAAGVRVLANRGASGIDGVVSSALGAAAGGGDGPAVLVLGDLSLYHDLNGLLAARLHRIPLTVVLLHNDGGGIFSFLPQATLGDAFEPLFATPTGLDFRPAVEMYGGRLLRPAGWEAFREAVRTGLEERALTVVEVRSERKRNAALHREAWRRVEAAVAPILEVARP
ncbi:2-succinyl-5-enolpyruvyl-6-hydroxy-3-cyclohexene-1-carboxylic-acid synthase [Limnochorda pilosa]|uniref:2-succinyl-5-enolpyruvyl-6-hydroxy-3-cyclohexene-1-carboxylate synthase n=1 Tax=Limnochorda pilosa TaxID=1555112 RepID=A0A0K2SMC3_LIMPI|nr:2-succinyl-5-enolpyruvyl-6-hydroxy-3-cyclohexene-1-carboxylic-acid synthase [Limnochorda pilosa]BAS28266.1 2-succinyl-5-enolpyruvyl-6-hydroxy-3-cyclohexene-1-carboxylate synthase [Limnochorda pilosa]